VSDEFDVIVIGGGAVGENVIDRCVEGGLSTVLVEAELVGGECSYWACMPSKALLRSPLALDAARRVSGAAEAVTGELDVAAVLRRRDDFVHHHDDATQVRWLEELPATLVRGHGRLVGERTVEVDGRRLTARHAVALCTGSAALIPDVPGLREAGPWTSRQATTASQAPRRLVVLGGGVVAVEMATAWSRLGCEEVTVLERGERILPGHEPRASELVTEGLRRLGVDVRTEVTVERVERADAVRVHLAGGAALEADEVLVAAGRRPRTDDLGLDVVGLEPGSWVSVDDHGRVPGVSWLWASGDLTHRALLTHQGKYDARACGDAIVAVAQGLPDHGTAWEPWGRFHATADARAVPAVVFSDPEVASVGLTEAAAVRHGIRVQTVDYDLGDVAGASVHADDYSGWANLVVDADRQVVVGATLVGQDVGELLHAATVMVVGEVPIRRLWHAVPSYPTISEIWLRLLERLGRGTA
jgi:pyruvate/2-oxoglutarate dehydrogenase complex dihydrolipoamide dehydrogenase (E3) component